MAIDDIVEPNNLNNVGLLENIYRISVAGFGGILAPLLKLSTDYDSLTHGAALQNGAEILTKYGAQGGFAFIFGGVVGWAMGETNRLKLLMLGASAPALIST